MCQQLPRILTRLRDDLCVTSQVGHPQRGQPVLSRPEQIPRAAQLKIDLGQFESVGRVNKRLQTLPSLLVLRLGEDAYIAGKHPTAHPTPQLVQLRQTETLTMFDRHQVGIGYVDADLHHRCGHQDLGMSGLELPQGVAFVVGRHSAVQ